MVEQAAARAEILARVRAATATATATAYAGPARVSAAASVDLFAERVADYRAVVERCSAAELSDRVLAAVRGCSVVVPPGLDVAVPGALVDDGLTPVELDAVDAVVTGATLGIAETGTIVLTHGSGQGRRAITLVPDRHVCLVRADQVVAGVADAAAALAGELGAGRPQTWISGPSATSDIELDRVEGVHGPRRLHVIVVEGPGPLTGRQRHPARDR